MNGRHWTQPEAAMAAAIWQRYYADHYGDDIDLSPVGTVKQTLQRIALATGRSTSSVDCRYRSYGSSFGANRESSRGASAHEIADRDARKEAEYRRDLTARFFGDPAPGFSELDRKQSLNHRATAVCSAAERSS